ncbi:MAG: hypothetical protein WD059_08145 [Balneolaceae bacterium]
MNKNDSPSLTEKQAEQIRKACINAAREGFINASMSGLCTEGAAEAAIGAIQKLNLNEVLLEAGSKK